jgi:hypothetical protein
MWIQDQHRRTLFQIKLREIRPENIRLVGHLEVVALGGEVRDRPVLGVVDTGLKSAFSRLFITSLPSRFVSVHLIVLETTGWDSSLKKANGKKPADNSLNTVAISGPLSARMIYCSQ